jgi:hypothetical protein
MVNYTLHCFHITINVSSSVFRGHENNFVEPEECCLLGCHTVHSVKTLPPFCSNLLPPYSG